MVPIMYNLDVMKCPIYNKLRFEKINIEEELRSLISSPTGTIPLGTETPKGRLFTKENRTKYKKLKLDKESISKKIKVHLEECALCNQE